MNKVKSKQNQGFTIIEVILVLAIAGLIFLMMFIALPALQRSQRDSRRRDDISILLKKLKDFQTNNRGALPNSAGSKIGYDETSSGSSWKGFYHDYLGDKFEDPNGGNYVLTITNCKEAGGRVNEECDGIITSSSKFSGDMEMRIFVGSGCDGDKAIVNSNPRKVSVQYKLEGGGVYCANT